MRYRLLSGLFILALPVASIAEGTGHLLQMIEGLQQRIERLEAHTGIVSTQDDAANAEPVKIVRSENNVNGSGRVMTRYWLSQQSEFNPAEPPLREGRMVLTMPVKLKPQQYGYSSTGMFDKHKDPSVYPLAVLIIKGELQMSQAGDYLLVVKPTPPREVGGAGNVQVSIELRIGNELVYRMPYSKSLSRRQQRLSLQSGNQPMELRIVTRPPGFGPRQTGTEVYLG